MGLVPGLRLSQAVVGHLLVPRWLLGPWPRWQCCLNSGSSCYASTTLQMCWRSGTAALTTLSQRRSWVSQCLLSGHSPWPPTPPCSCRQYPHPFQQHKGILTSQEPVNFLFICILEVSRTRTLSMKEANLLLRVFVCSWASWNTSCMEGSTLTWSRASRLWLRVTWRMQGSTEPHRQSDPHARPQGDQALEATAAGASASVKLRYTWAPHPWKEAERCLTK